ncbi:EF-hand domain-containing family member C2-like isoform X2 [Daktulosphaira vitifoliae]|uniref:EF-hand domain-containing family member C2-like isoform X2 n=1 Tax=Daktulosphaira vitifoliae TaxID=58002 RepID=UPI0021AA8F6F|nr:EF-hand domain-containing family member C2-like isoform X2 [Daktulosphaira vitifoliae]
MFPMIPGFQTCIKALSFDAYFENMSANSFGCSNKIRKCKIIYFLEDNTIKVIEPIIINSGIPQGCLIKRHAIPLPNSDGQYYHLFDLNVGSTVEFYGKKFIITAADSFTRDFLRNVGVDVPDNLPMPDDDSLMSKQNAHQNELGSHTDGVVHRRKTNIDGILNFKGFWDDRQSADGVVHSFDIQYYLIDDTMKIVEHEENRKLKTFLKRQKIPKDYNYIKPPGFCEPYNLLNVLGVNPLNRWYSFDPLSNSKHSNNAYYKWYDLYIAKEINVYGRNIVLNYCDEFTKQFYLDNDLNNFLSIDSSEAKKETSNVEVNNESICNDNIILSTFQSDVDIDYLIFKAKALFQPPNDGTNDFIIKYHLRDQSFSVFEMKGNKAGKKFISKRKLQNVGDNQIPTILNLYAGNEVTIDSYKFLLADVDDRTLKFMMNHPIQFPHCDVKCLMNQVSEIIEPDIDRIYTEDFESRDLIERTKFVDIMTKRLCRLSQHSILVIALQYKKLDDKCQLYNDKLRSIVHDELKRHLFESFDGLAINFKKRNYYNKSDGYLDRDNTMKALKSSKIPLSDEIIEMLLKKFTDSDTKKVSYVKLLKYLDYISDPEVCSSQESIKEIVFKKPNQVFIKVRELITDLRRQK